MTDNARPRTISRKNFVRSMVAVPFVGTLLTACTSSYPKRLKEPGKALMGLPKSGGQYRLPPLPYAADALEPDIDARTMRIHHDRHHQGYVNKLNAALDQAPAFRDRPLADVLANLESVPGEVRTAVRQNGGGHANHSLFWTVIAPGGADKPSGDLAKGEQHAAFLTFEPIHRAIHVESLTELSVLDVEPGQEFPVGTIERIGRDRLLGACNTLCDRFLGRDVLAQPTAHEVQLRLIHGQKTEILVHGLAMLTRQIV